MKTITRRTAALVAAGALGLGGLAVAAPALAGAGPFGPGPSSTATGNPSVSGRGFGYGRGSGMGSGFGDGTCMGMGITAQQGTLTNAQKTTLVSMAQEEKLAHDLYVAFAARYDAVVFDHIAVAETHHLTAVRSLLQRYAVTDPTANQPAGTLNDPAVQATYDKLLAEGKQSVSAALAVGQQVERTDIADLKTALNGLTAPDVKQRCFCSLRAGRRNSGRPAYGSTQSALGRSAPRAPVTAPASKQSRRHCRPAGSATRMRSPRPWPSWPVTRQPTCTVRSCRWTAERSRHEPLHRLQADGMTFTHARWSERSGGVTRP